MDDSSKLHGRQRKFSNKILQSSIYRKTNSRFSQKLIDILLGPAFIHNFVIIVSKTFIVAVINLLHVLLLLIK